MKIKQLFSFCVGMIALISVAFGQADLSMPYHTTILATNTDLVNKLVLVEFANIPLTTAGNCLNYTLRFRIKHNQDSLGYQPIKVISTAAKYSGKSIVEQCEYNQSESDGGPGAITCAAAS
ncbi:MAG: hypothetical protein ACRCSB_04030, partial [Bacteroidales bacterium]